MYGHSMKYWAEDNGTVHAKPSHRTILLNAIRRKVLEPEGGEIQFEPENNKHGRNRVIRAIIITNQSHAAHYHVLRPSIPVEGGAAKKKKIVKIVSESEWTNHR